VPALDLVLLGLGSDGHCGSIFPGKPAMEVRDRAVVGVPEAGLDPFVPRVTMTLPVFNAAREVLFMVTGEGKADAVARAFGGEPREDTPASYVRPPKLTVLLDPPAASLLPNT
jgi:6-phosphogluconolactonase